MQRAPKEEGRTIIFPHWRGNDPPQKEDADSPKFTPEHTHLLLQGVYRNFPCHNDESHLDGGVVDDAVWQQYWCHMAAQSASWYSTTPGAVGCRFVAILAAEWRRYSTGVVTLRDPLSSPTSSSLRCWAYAGPGRLWVVSLG